MDIITSNIIDEIETLENKGFSRMEAIEILKLNRLDIISDSMYQLSGITEELNDIKSLFDECTYYANDHNGNCRRLIVKNL